MLSEVEKDWGIIQEQDFSEVAPKMYFCLQEVEFDVNGTKGKLCPGDVVELEDDIANVLMEGRHITRAVWRLGPQHAR